MTFPCSRTRDTSHQMRETSTHKREIMHSVCAPRPQDTPKEMTSLRWELRSRGIFNSARVDHVRFFLLDIALFTILGMETVDSGVTHKTGFGRFHTATADGALCIVASLLHCKIVCDVSVTQESSVRHVTQRLLPAKAGSKHTHTENMRSGWETNTAWRPKSSARLAK